MAEVFLHLPEGERAEILTARAIELGVGPALLEKDVWVCWTLKTLFEMHDALPMVFKGGTSLSKIYDAIGRFSEDVDLTIDHASLRPDLEPFADDVSRSALKRMTKALNSAVVEYMVMQIAPHLERRFTDEFGDQAVIEVDEAKQSLSLPYPTAVEPTDYVMPRVLLEFGGRNAIDPSGSYSVKAYMQPAFPGLEFPEVVVTALAAERTFWEKATLVHVECNRGARANADRLVRHWYDLYRLARLDIGERALADRALLADVVRYKSAFFHSSSANYSACLNGGLRIVPDDRDHVDHLRADYRAMSTAGMFTDTPPTFDELIGALATLQERLNRPRARN